LAMAMASEGGQALAIGAIKIGTRILNCSQNAAARVRAGCMGMRGHFTGIACGFRDRFSRWLSQAAASTKGEFCSPRP